MKRPIILHITPSLMIGGAEKFLVDLLEELQKHPKNQFEHRVAYFQAGPNLEKLHALGITTYPIQGLFTHYDPICFWRLLRLIQKVKPIHLQSMLWSANFYTRLIGKFLAIPTICAIHSEHNNGNTNHDSWLKLKIDQLTLRWANQVVTVSDQITAKYLDQKFKLLPNKLITIHNGIKIPIYLKKPTNSQFTIGHVGRFVPVKNQTLLIHALKLVHTTLPNFQATIIGYGALEESLKNLVFQLGLTKQITFIHSYQPENHYPNWDCFVLPSHTEGLSIALLEAMSFGVVPVITALSPHPIVQHEFNGFICEPDNPTLLAKSILKIAQNHPLRNSLSQAARNTAKHKFNLNLSTQRYLSLYPNLAN